MECPKCGNELDEDNYCYECGEFFNEEDLQESDSNYFEELDYDSMVNNGEAICLNCTFWSVSPYGAAYGMVCRKGQMPNGPADSCGMFTRERHFASYGEEGQYQFDESDRAIANKLYYWRISR